MCLNQVTVCSAVRATTHKSYAPIQTGNESQGDESIDIAHTIIYNEQLNNKLVKPTVLIINYISRITCSTLKTCDSS